jgi:hypothetical protein
MPSGEEKTFPSRTASRSADLDPKLIDSYWQLVEKSLRKVFGKSDKEAYEAVVKMRHKAAELPEPARLLIYHDTPLQIASILAGASHRALTENELLAYNKLWRYPPDVKDRPSREQMLRVHGAVPKVG